MKHIFSKLLSALLVAVFLLSPVALMEEEIEITEPVDEIVEEQSVDIVEEDTLSGDEVYTYSGDTYAAAPSDELFAAAGKIAINAMNFPDASFRDYITNNFDTDHSGGLSASEIANAKSIPGNISIQDYTGIKLFTSLENLSVSDSAVTLDVSGLTSLNALYIFDSYQLTSLNISGCTNITHLDCKGGALTSLNLDGCTNLKELFCGNNQLTSLDVSNLANLETLRCFDNQITWINVDGCAKLSYVICSNNQLSNDAIRYLAGALPNLTDLDFGGNSITSLPLSSLKKLESLGCENLNLTSLNLSGFTNLTGLDCSNNKLTSLDISDCKNMGSLKCGNNKIKKLDISNCKKLLTSYTKGAHKTENGQENYFYQKGWTEYTLEYDSGVKLTTKGGKSSSSSSSKTKLASKKLKVTAYVGTPVQMDTNGETGKSFKSSNKKIATVNSKGVVTPKKAGKCKITYKTASASYTVTITVKDLTIPKYVVLNLKGTIAAKVGEPQTLTATMNDGAVSKLKWTTSNKKIATVKNGVVTFKKKGTVTITVTTVKGKKKAKVKFKVSN